MITLTALLFIIVQVFAGSIAGFITNVYAINMLFRNYYGLGGVIPKTKMQFIENISQLVERDIISHKNLSKEINSLKFKKHIEHFVDDVFNASIQKNIKNMTVGDIRGMKQSTSHTKKALIKALKTPLNNSVNLLLDKLTLDQLEVKKISTDIINYSIESLADFIIESTLFEEVMNSVYEKNKHVTIKDLIGEPNISKLIDNLKTILNEIHLHTLNNSDDYNNLILELLDIMFTPAKLNDLELLLKEKRINEILYNINSNLSLEFLSEILINYLDSKDGIKLFELVVDKLFNILIALDMPLIKLFPDEYQDKLLTFLEANIPYIAQWIVNFLDKNEEEINRMINESVDEAYLVGEQGFIAEFSLSAYLKKIVLDKGLTSTNVSETARDKVDAVIEDNNDLLILISGLIINFLKEKDISWMTKFLLDKGIINLARLSKTSHKLIRANSSKYLSKVIGYLEVRKLEDLIKLDLIKLYSDNKDKLVSFLSQVIFKQYKTSDKALDFLGNRLKSIVEMTVEELLSEYMKPKNTGIIKGKLASLIRDKSDEILGKALYWLDSKTRDTKLNVLIKDKTSIYQSLLNQITNLIDDLDDKLTKYPIKKIVDNIKQIKNFTINSASFLHSALDKSLESILKGKIQKLVSDNLIDQDEKQLIKIIEKFMGSQLKPITYLGALLGAIAGLALALMSPNKNLLTFSISGTLITMCIFGLVGIVTNIIALEMIFKPYKKIEVLARLPILKYFSQGVLVKNRENFAYQMANFVDAELLNKARIEESFSNSIDKIEKAMFNEISADDYKMISKVINENKDIIVEKLYESTIAYMKEDSGLLVNELSGKLGEIELNQLDLLTYINEYIGRNEAIICDIKNRMIEKLYTMLKTKKVIDFISLDQGNKYLVYQINKGFKDASKNLAGLLSDEELIHKIIANYSAMYNHKIEKPLSQILIWPDNIGALMTKYIFTYLDESFGVDTLSPWIQGLISKFDNLGEFKAYYIKKDTREFIENSYASFMSYTFDKLLENKKVIRKQILNSIDNLLIEGIANLFYKNDIERIIGIFLVEKAPGFIEREKAELVDGVMDFLNNRVFSVKTKDLNIEENIKNAVDFVKAIMNDPNHQKSFQEITEENMDKLLMLLYNKPLIEYLTVLGGGSLKELLDTYGDRLQDLIHKVTSLDKSTFLALKSFISHKLFKLYVTPLFDYNIERIFADIEVKDIEEVIDHILNTGENHKVIQAILSLMNTLYDSKYKEVKIKRIINLNNIGLSLNCLIDSLIKDEEVQAIYYEFLYASIDTIAKDNLQIISPEMKEHLVQIILKTGLDAASKNVPAIISDIDFKGITIQEISKMEAKEIHKLFNSFAGQYFVKLRIYGVLGMLCGIHFSVAFLWFLADKLDLIKSKDS